MTKGNPYRAIEGTTLFRAVRNRLNRKLFDYFRSSVFPGRDNLVVLEAACGSGYATDLLALDRRVKLSVGLDVSFEVHNRSGIERGGLRVVGDIYALPFSDNVFDLVWNSSSVEELPDPSVAVKAMTNVASKGGYIFVGVPYLLGPLGLYHLIPFKSLREWLGKPFSGRQLERLFRQNNLMVENKIKYLVGCFIGLLGRKT